jgi:hypothetical protein
MQRELKLVVIFSAMAFLFVMPLGMYLMSFQGQGLSGEVLGYLGVFVLTPYAVLHTYAGHGASILLLGMLLEYPWIMLWVACMRWYYLRKSRVAQGRAQ